MTRKIADTQESIDEKRLEHTLQLKRIALEEGPTTCQICGRKLREGDKLTAYAFRAAGNPILQIGYVMCGADKHAHPTEFMRGVHELVVTGRVGVCTDVATQSEWQVLLAPEPLVESHPRSTDTEIISEKTAHFSREVTDTDASREGFFNRHSAVPVDVSDSAADQTSSSDASRTEEKNE